ncbi:MAG: hypothetical protein PHH82_03805 [Candidatus ainarchaeum sp.]|nr:hypothetical protein [Candidatus ainarchaeum sp.]
MAYRKTISDVQRAILEGRDLRHNFEQRDFAQMARAKRTVRIHLNNGKILFGRFVLPQEEKIRAKVKALGIPTEEVSTDLFAGYEIPESLRDKFHIFKSAGIAIKDMSVMAFGKQFWSALNLVRDELPGYLAKLHNAGIRHGHLHSGNIVYDPQTNRISIIDFSAAKDFGDISTYVSEECGPARIHVQERKWKDIDELMKVMGQDYQGIMPTLGFMTEEEFKDFWGKVYDLYDLKYKDEKQRTLFVYKMVYLRSKYAR